MIIVNSHIRCQLRLINNRISWKLWKINPNSSSFPFWCCCCPTGDNSVNWSNIIEALRAETFRSWKHRELELKQQAMIWWRRGAIRGHRRKGQAAVPMSLLGAVLLSLNIIVPLFSSQRHQQRPASIYFPSRVPRYERNRRNWFESRTRTTYRHPGDLAERIHFCIFNKVQDMINQKLKMWYNFTFTFESFGVCIDY